MGGADQRTAAERLLRQRIAGCEGSRLGGFVVCVLRHDGWASVRVAGCGRQLVPDRTRSAGRAFCRGSDAGMIRVALPAHLRTLAQISGEVDLDLTGAVTQRTLLDALE